MNETSSSKVYVKPPKLLAPSRIVDRAILFVWRRVFNIAVLTVIVSISGYFVVHSYLRSLTGIATYQIDPVVYLAAGVNFLVNVPSTLIRLFLPTMLVTVIFIVVFGVTFSSFTFLRRRSPQFDQWYMRFQQSKLFARMVLLGYGLRKVNNFVLLLLIMLPLLAIAVTYGQELYDESPREIGGGTPSPVTLVFKHDVPLAQLGLPITISSLFASQSETVDLIMELRNGLLVRDRSIGIPFIVRDELIVAVIDAQPPPLVTVGTQSTLTATPAASPTATP